jgi:hypothetical protein
MLERLQTHVPRFREQWAETIAWCSGQPVESDLIESIEIQKRRKLGRKAGELSRRAFLSSGPELWKSYLRRRARRLFERAKLENINPLAHQLRSPVLDPGCTCFPSGRFQQLSVVDQLSTRRAEQLRLEHRYPVDPPLSFHDGKFLLYAPNENLFDGAAQYSSKGFFNVDNVPPWDTWVCFFGEYLVSWVPPQLLELANAGVEANPEQCILWAPES